MVRSGCFFTFGFLNSSKHGNAEIYYLLKDTRNLFQGISIRISHIMREGNACADFLANLGAHSQTLVTFGSSDVPHYLRGLINLDRMNLPYFRFSK